MPNFAGINQIGSVCVHTCRRDSDRSMAGPRQIVSRSQRVGSTSPEYAFRHSGEERSGSLAPFRCSKSAADHSYLCSKNEKRGFGFQSLVQRHPRHRLFIFAGESLRGKRCDHLEFSLVLLPIVGVRVGRYVFVLGDLEDMDITHFLHVVGSEVSVTAESSIWRMPKRRGDWCGNGGPLPNVRACKEARVRRLEASSVLSEICRERWPPESQIDHRRAREVRGEQPADASLVELRDRALRSGS